jgi:hypothetical protein
MATGTSGRSRADDLANPVLPAAARAANVVLARAAPRRWPFDAETIKARAMRTTGLTDFGVDVPLDEPLTALCADLDAGPPMHPLGRYAIVRGIVTSLANRYDCSSSPARGLPSLTGPSPNR